jgi:thioredoxin 1
MSAVLAVGDSDFDSTVASPDRPVLVDFSADWCGPCKAMAPALESFAAKRSGELTVAKVDIDRAPQVASRYAIRSVPTLMLFKDGKPVAMQPGMMSESQLAEFVEPHLARERRTVEQDPSRPQVDLDW